MSVVELKPVPHEPDPGLVELAEDLLELVKSGEVVSLIVIADKVDATMCMRRLPHDTTSISRVLGAIELTKHRVLTEDLND